METNIFEIFIESRSPHWVWSRVHILTWTFDQARQQHCIEDIIKQAGESRPVLRIESAPCAKTTLLITVTPAVLPAVKGFSPQSAFEFEMRVSCNGDGFTRETFRVPVPKGIVESVTIDRKPNHS